MLQISTSLTYSVLTLLSTGKKSFENMGKLIRKSGDTVARLLQAAKISKTHCQEISKELFKDSKQLYVIIDDTLIKKFFSEVMEGSGSFFDIKIGRRINAFKLVFGMISDGKFAIPTECAYLFSKEILEHMHGKIKSKNDMRAATERLFSRGRIKPNPPREEPVLEARRAAQREIGGSEAPRQNHRKDDEQIVGP